jgi:hypothetical protein
VRKEQVLLGVLNPNSEMAAIPGYNPGFSLCFQQLSLNAGIFCFSRPAGYPYENEELRPIIGLLAKKFGLPRQLL